MMINNDNIEEVEMEVDYKYNKRAELIHDYKTLRQNIVVFSKKRVRLYEMLTKEVPQKEKVAKKRWSMINYGLAIFQGCVLGFCFPELFFLSTILIVILILIESVIGIKIVEHMIEKHRNDIIEKIRTVDLEFDKTVSDLLTLDKVINRWDSLNFSEDEKEQRIFTYSFNDSKLVPLILDDEELKNRKSGIYGKIKKRINGINEK